MPRNAELISIALQPVRQGPPQGGPFFAGQSVSRRRLLKWGGGAAVAFAPMLAQASSFDDFFRAIAADSESDLLALALRGFDVNTRNDKFEPPLVLALRLESLKAFAFLLSRPQTDVNARNANDETALMLAALKARVPQCQALIRRGADVNKPGWTPLHYAASNPSEKALTVVQLLLDEHAYIDAESPNKSTPLMLAAMYGYPQLVPLLLDAGADASLRNEQGLTALDFAHRAGRASVAELIAKTMRGSTTKGSW